LPSRRAASPSAAAAAVELAVKRFGGLDIVVNNAAILRDAFIFKADPLAWDAVIRTNLTAPFHVLAAATPVMREQAKAERGGKPYRWGRIVNIVSTAGLYGNFGQAAYASAKAYLAGPPPMVEAATILLLERGVRRADIHADAFYTEAEKQALEAKAPLAAAAQ